MALSRSSVVVAALCGLFALGGCQKDPPKVLPAHLAGAWVEIPDTNPPNPRIPVVARLSPMMRKIAFKDDGTYKLTLSKPDGSGEDASRSISGTWKFEGGSFVLEPGQNTLGANYKAWTPTMAAMDPPIDDKSPPAAECTITHENSSQARYRRLQ